MSDLTHTDVPERLGAAPASPRRRRPGPAVLATALVLLVVFTAWAAVAGRELLTARGELEDARAAMLRGVAALGEADVEVAAGEFLAARDRFARGGGRLEGPLVRPLWALPIVGDDLRTVGTLAGAGEGVASASAQLTVTVLELPGGVRAFSPVGGVLPVDALAAVGPPLSRLRAAVDEATVAVDATPADTLLPPVADARRGLAAQLEEVGPTLAVAEPAVRGLPALLGADRPRRYLFAATNPAELRGAIGFVGAYSVVTLDRGRLSFERFAALQDLPDLPQGSVDPPYPAFEERYPDEGGASVWRNLVLSPDFAETAEGFERLWVASGAGPPLDGTIAADPFALAALLQVTGPVAVPGGDTVDAEGVVPYLTNEAYSVVTDSNLRKRLLGDVAGAVVAAFVTSGLDDPEGSGAALEVLAALGGAARDGHVLLHSADPDLQRLLAQAGVDGGLRAPQGDFVAPFVSGTTSSKIDYYLERALDYDVRLEADGAASGSAQVTLVNRAPTTGPPPYVIGPNREGLTAGQNQVYLSLYAAGDATIGDVRLDGAPADERRATELDHPVAEVFADLPAGGRAVVTAPLARAPGWVPDGRGGGSYLLVVQHQVGVQPAQLDLAITPPPGTRFTTVSDGVRVEGGVARLAGPVGTIREVEVAFAPDPPERR